MRTKRVEGLAVPGGPDSFCEARNGAWYAGQRRGHRRATQAQVVDAMFRLVAGEGAPFSRRKQRSQESSV
jgi:hypothetical protein